MAAKGGERGKKPGETPNKFFLNHSADHAKGVYRFFRCKNGVVGGILMAKVSYRDGVSLKFWRRICCFGGVFQDASGDWLTLAGLFERGERAHSSLPA